MKTLGLLLTLLVVAPQAPTDQRPAAPAGTIITSAEVTGFDIDRLSPGLRREIRSLAGTPLKQERLDELARRIEAERPRHIAAVRTFMDPGGQARVIFIVGQASGAGDQEDNVNARYLVEHAEITGVPDGELTPALRDDLQALVGKRLDSTDADRLQERIERELPRYDVTRRILRGTEPGRIRLVYEARKKEVRWLRFEPLRSNVVYHSDQGWGSYLDLGLGDRNIRFTPLVAIDDGDDLIEEYSGFGLRFETRKMGTGRLGASLEWSTFDQSWRGATLNAVAASPQIPPLYETRSTITPLLKFAFSPEVTVSAGVSISELDARAPATGSQAANAAVATLGYDERWKGDSGATQDAGASFGVRAGSRSLESDLAYTRYLAQGAYRYERGRHQVLATGMAGGITGDAPLFERFSLGDSTTLRGWDKYDIAPAGGDRLLYSSVEYRYGVLALFLDVGSVWDHDTERRVRVSTGLGFRAGPAFVTVGFPLNTDKVTAIVTMGIRVTGESIRW